MAVKRIASEDMTRRGILLRAFEETLNKIAAYGRPPSRWEEDVLARALAATACGDFPCAANELIELKESRPEIDLGREVARPARAHPLSLSSLRQGLATLRALD
jgi:hypothetical protein